PRDQGQCSSRDGQKCRVGHTNAVGPQSQDPAEEQQGNDEFEEQHVRTIADLTQVAVDVGVEMNIVEATRRYDRWLARRLPVIVQRDLRAKHRHMAEEPFAFLRATFYRWAQVWPHLCPELAGAPRVLGVGDLHLENFGTWRDGEGRLIWGI